MSTWNIYHKDGSKLTDVNGEQITVHGLEYSDSWMGECFLTINFKHEVPINFQIGDYIVYRGERFELNYEPGKDKQARPDTYGEGFVYDSVKFNALQDELARAEFLDVVLNDNELHYSSLPKFMFYVQTLDDLLDRIQANLDEQIGKGLWKIYSRNMERSVQRGALKSEWLTVYGEKTDDNVIESMSITVDSQTCWQALALVNEKWDINFIVRGRNIYVGTTGIQANHIFKYGLGKGLYEIVQNADSDQSVVTRLRAYGSEKNLPSHYYADLGVKYVANITKVVTATTYVDLDLDIDYIETYFKNQRKYIVSGESGEQSGGWVLKVTFDFKTEITGYVTQRYNTNKCRFYSEYKGTQVDSGDEESRENLNAFIAQVKAGNTKMYITSGLNKKTVPSSMKEYSENLPNNMAVNRLMLPGFPHLSLSDFYESLTEEEKKYVNPTGKQHKFSTNPYRPYIDSVNIEQIGLRSASQFFDTDDKTNGVIEIYPTIEEMEIGGVRVDEIDEGVAPNDDGRFGDNETVKNVDIYLNKAIDFDITDLKDDDFSISMKDGMCGGRTFKVAASNKVDGRWRLTIERVKDDAIELWFPYKDYPIKKGDHFVLTGITLPDSYVKAASLKLLKYAIALLDKNDYTRYVYQPKVDELFMARQHDLAEKDTTGVIKSLHDTLKAGDLMNFNDTDLNIDGVISIDQLTIKEEDGKIPTYDITLREDKEVGTIQKIQQQISSLQSGNGGTGAGLTTTQVKNQVATEGSKYFVSKVNDDTAKGTITWEKVQKFVSGLLVGKFNSENGGSWTPDAEGRSHLITDYLEVRMKAIFEELAIKKNSTIGGKEIISPAGGVAAYKVDEVTVTYNDVSQKAYRCYFLAEQDGDKIDNDFVVEDQVRSESFNLNAGKYHKTGNHFFWRLVIGIDEEPVEFDGKKYHYIDLSETDCATGSDVPMKGDVLSQCGNRSDPMRQSCLVFSSVDTYAPCLSLYHGINSYSLNNKDYVEYGVDKSGEKPKAFFHSYGDAYIGDRPTKDNNYEGDSYIKYDSEKKKVTIKAELSIKSTFDGKSLEQQIKDNAPKGLSESDVDTIIKNSETITNLKNQIDGAIETWFYDGVPTLKNEPAVGWTDKEKKNHLGDLYYDNLTGKAYRFAKDGDTYKWTIITDIDIAKALSDASKAQETAGGKMKVFATQPTPPYQLGDIWVNATYPSDGSTYKNEVLRCQTDKKAGSQFAIADWIKASKYTDDTVANAAKKAAEEAQKAAQTAQTNITNLDKTVTNNKNSFDNYVKDGYLEPSEIAAMAQDSKRLEDDFAAAEKSYNEVKGAEVLKSTKELTDLNAAFTTLTTAKTELITYLSDISARYNATDADGKKAIYSRVATLYDNFQTAYDTFYNKLGLANAYITTTIIGKLNAVIGDVASYNYLKGALSKNASTDINGGLILSSLIALRDPDTGYVESGINGVVDNTAKGNGIATWWGGYMNDGQVVGFDKKNDVTKQAATSLIRFDGSGYLANGAIYWSVDGKVHADPTSFIISEKNLGAYLAFFEPTWKSGSNGSNIKDLVSLTPQAPFAKLDVSNDLLVEGKLKIGNITLSVVNGALKIDGNVFATGGISAYGASSGAGGGGLNASVISYARIIEGSYTDADLTSIPNAYAIKALSSRIDNIATELGGLNLSWNNITGKPSTFTPSAHTHKWADITDRITKVSQLTNDAGYLTTHQSLDGYVNAIAVSGSGNAVTAVTKSGKTITFTKGATYLTSHQSLAAYLTKSEASSTYQPKGNYLTSHQSLSNYYTKGETDSKLSGYLPLSGGTMQANARITHGNGNLYIGNTANDNWLAVQDICSQASIGDGNWSIRVDGTANFQKIKFPSNRLIAQVSNGSNSPLKGIKLPSLASDAIGIFSRVGNSTDEGGIVLSEDTCIIYNSFDSGWGLSVRDKDLNQTDISSDDTVAFGVRETTYKLYSRGGFEKKDSSNDYVLLGGGGHSKITELSVSNADKLDGIHANGLLTAISNSDKGISITVGGTTKSVSNISVNYASSAGNADTVDGYHVNGSNVAPYGHIPSIETDGVMEVGKYIDFHNDNSGKHDFSTRLQTTDNHGNSVNLPSASGTLALISDNVASATKLKTARTIWGQSFDGTGNVSGFMKNVRGLIHGDSLKEDWSDGNNTHPWYGIDYRHCIDSTETGKSYTSISSYFGLYFKTGGSRFIFDGGDVGIGTTSPAYKLHVAGNIYASDTIIGESNKIGLTISGPLNGTWSSWFAHETAGNEALVIATQHEATAIMLANGESYTNISSERYKSMTPALTIEHNQVMINRPYSSSGVGYNFYVNGSSCFNGSVKVNNMLTAKAIMFTTADSNAYGTDLRNWDGSIGANVTNMFNGIPQDNIQVEYSIDNGASWNTYPGNSESRFNLVNDNTRVFNYYLGANNMHGDTNADKLAQIKKNQLRVTVKIPDEIYQELSWISVDVNNGVDIKCQVYFGSSTGGYKEYVSKIISGWAHKCDICVGPLNVNVGNDTYRYVRLVFSHPSNNTNLRNGIVAKIRALALTKYSYNNDRYTISTTGHIYDYDPYMNTYFPNSILAKGGVTAYQSSDVRLKTNITKLNCLNVIKSIGGTYEFDYLRDHKHSIGFIAQHVSNPLLKDIIAKDKDGYLKINYWSPKLISLAFGALTEIDNEVDKLKARVRELETEVEYLKK